MKKCPSSIQRQDLNPKPFKHESSPITTRPGLTPKQRWFLVDLKLHFNSNLRGCKPISSTYFDLTKFNLDWTCCCCCQKVPNINWKNLENSVKIERKTMGCQTDTKPISRSLYSVWKCWQWLICRKDKKEKEDRQVKNKITKDYYKDLFVSSPNTLEYAT